MPALTRNAVDAANTPMLDRLMANYPMVQLKAHGTAVGLPTDEDMGNSGVAQRQARGESMRRAQSWLTNRLRPAKCTGQTRRELVGYVRQSNGTLHFIGLLSDGNVHSHIKHLMAMIMQASRRRAPGEDSRLASRDVGDTSALEYIAPFEEYIAGLRSEDFDVMTPRRRPYEGYHGQV